MKAFSADDRSVPPPLPAGRTCPRVPAVPTAALAAAACLLLFLLACSDALPPPPDAVARIGSSHLGWEAFEEYVAAEAGVPPAFLEPAASSGLLDRLLGEEMVRRLAVERGLVPPAASRREALRAIVESAAAEPIPPAAVEAWYAAHPERHERPERVRLRQILVRDRETAEALRRELVAGAEFGELARTYSTDPSGPAGGVQGELARDELPPTLAAVVFALEPGEISPVVTADYGFHIFRVDARLPAGRVPLAQARDAIRRHLEGRRVDAALAELEVAARRRYNPVVYAAHLPFPYEGSLPTRRTAD